MGDCPSHRVVVRAPRNWRDGIPEGKLCRFLPLEAQPSDRQGLEGLYIDSSGVLASENQFNDSGYTDPSGERKSTINLFETREAYKRLYNLFKSRVPDSMIWSHPVPITALASFVDVSCSGEEWTDSSSEIENLTPDFFRAAYKVCANRGFPYVFYPGHPRGYPEKIRYEDIRKFSDLRGLVDALHDRGLSVVLWWAPLCFDAAASMSRKDWMFCKGLDVHGERLIDYSSPRVQREHLAPLMRRMFSADPDCWNLDGVKIDFLADRHHLGARVADDTWHGQERY